ncbi:MAG TPA: enoyl-CoA hydratase-related protein, partial [Acetobacteraceae bacterium]|nr:enoyl-CoA hydratase-related protein [Acetobacteraceae bacterium]
MSAAEQPVMRVNEDRDGAVLILTIDYPSRRNALGVPVRTMLEEALERAHADKAIRAVVLTGAGGNFCSG